MGLAGLSFIDNCRSLHLLKVLWGCPQVFTVFYEVCTPNFQPWAFFFFCFFAFSFAICSHSTELHSNFFVLCSHRLFSRLSSWEYTAWASSRESTCQNYCDICPLSNCFCLSVWWFLYEFTGFCMLILISLILSGYFSANILSIALVHMWSYVVEQKQVLLGISSIASLCEIRLLWFISGVFS